MECVKCVCVWLGAVYKRIGFGLYQSCGNMGSVGCVFGLRWCGWYRWERVVWRCYVCVSCQSGLFVQVQVSVYCARRIPAHLRCTQCSILLQLIDICFLSCICSWPTAASSSFLATSMLIFSIYSFVQNA